MARKVCCSSVLVSFGLLVAAQASAGEWIAGEEGIRLWNSNPQANTTCRWTGGKDENGLAHGGGLVLWSVRAG